MIKSQHDLQRFLQTEKKNYLRKPLYKQIFDRLCNKEPVVIWEYVKDMRMCEYYINNKNKSLWHYLMYLFYFRKHNRNCIRLGLLIGPNVFDEGLCIYHSGNIVVNGYSRVGKNCKLHGDNCIGNSKSDKDVPIIGNNVRLGVGAKVIGHIYIADNVTIAAGAVVNKSCFEEGALLAGIPAKIINNKYDTQN